MIRVFYQTSPLYVKSESTTDRRSPILAENYRYLELPATGTCQPTLKLLVLKNKLI